MDTRPRGRIICPVNTRRGGMAERTNALVLKTRGRKTPEGSNPSTPARSNRPLTLNLLKIVNILETFAFRFCTLGAPLC